MKTIQYLDIIIKFYSLVFQDIVHFCSGGRNMQSRELKGLHRTTFPNIKNHRNFSHFWPVLTILITYDNPNYSYERPLKKGVQGSYPICPCISLSQLCMKAFKNMNAFNLNF